jgi:hypothetical protein
MIELIAVTGLDQQTITVNVKDIVSFRAARGKEHFGKGIRCILHTVDGKFIAVIETCKMVEEKLGK